MWLHKIVKKKVRKKRGKVRSLVEAVMRRLWLTTERLRHFFFPSFLILIKGSVQHKQCLPTLQFKRRGPLRPQRWFLNVHWQAALICVLSRWRWTYIYISVFLGTISPSGCLVYICHAVLKVRTAPATEPSLQHPRRCNHIRVAAPLSIHTLLPAVMSSLCPARFVRKSRGQQKKTLSSCGRPSTATGFHNSSSDKVTRVQVAEMHCLVSVIITSIEDDGSATRPESHDAPRSHDAVTVSKCQRQKMTVCHEKQQMWGGIRLQAGRSWLRSRGVKAADGKPECADTLAVHYASPKFSLHAAENKVWLIKADGSVEKRAIMRKSSALCRWQWCKQKALLSSPAGGFFFFSVEPLW